MSPARLWAKPFSHIVSFHPHSAKGRGSRVEQRWDSTTCELATLKKLLTFGSLKNSQLFIHLINLQSERGSAESLVSTWYQPGWFAGKLASLRAVHSVDADADADAEVDAVADAKLMLLQILMQMLMLRLILMQKLMLMLLSAQTAGAPWVALSYLWVISFPGMSSTVAWGDGPISYTGAQGFKFPLSSQCLWTS